MTAFEDLARFVREIADDRDDCVSPGVAKRASTLVARLDKDDPYNTMLSALEDAQRMIQKHGFGGFDQNPFGIRDLIGHAIIKAGGPLPGR